MEQERNTYHRIQLDGIYQVVLMVAYHINVVNGDKTVAYERLRCEHAKYSKFLFIR